MPQRRGHADLREGPRGQDDHSGCRGLEHHQERQDHHQEQGGHPEEPAAPDLQGQAVGGWRHPQRLQHPAEQDTSPRDEHPRWRQAGEGIQTSIKDAIGGLYKGVL